jgi:hypothetical protein
MIRSDTIPNQVVWCAETAETVKKVDAKILGVGEKFEDYGRDRRSSTHSFQLHRSHFNLKPPANAKD